MGYTDKHRVVGCSGVCGHSAESMGVKCNSAL